MFYFVAKANNQSSTVSYTATGLQVGAAMQGMKTHYTFSLSILLNSFIFISTKQNKLTQSKIYFYLI